MDDLAVHRRVFELRNQTPDAAALLKLCWPIANQKVGLLFPIIKRQFTCTKTCFRDPQERDKHESVRSAPENAQSQKESTGAEAGLMDALRAFQLDSKTNGEPKEEVNKPFVALSMHEPIRTRKIPNIPSGSPPRLQVQVDPPAVHSYCP